MNSTLRIQRPERATEAVGLRLEPSIVLRLRAAADRHQVSVAELVRQLVHYGLEHLPEADAPNDKSEQAS